MEIIKINVGVYTPIEVDLTEYDFTGIEKVILTIKNYIGGEEIIEREFTTSEKHNVLISPEESRKLIGSPIYDFTKLTTDGKLYKESEIGNIELKYVVGEENE
jgi:hypothetical protein